MTTIEQIQRSSIELYDDITKELSEQSTKRYNKEKYSLLELDNWRSTELPELLKTRYEKDGKVWLDKQELVLLMDWKLAKGKFRPTLPKLINSNSEEDVERVTTEGFEIWSNFTSEQKPSGFWSKESNLKLYVATVRQTFKKLCELRGVGPATASLILNLLRINESLTAPFFSDESFLYYVNPEGKIKYNVKEYTDLLLPVYFKILKANATDSVNMITLEKGGWAMKMLDLHHVTKLANIKIDIDDNFSYYKEFKKRNGEEVNNDDVKPSTKKQKKE